MKIFTHIQAHKFHINKLLLRWIHVYAQNAIFSTSYLLIKTFSLVADFPRPCAATVRYFSICSRGDGYFGLAVTKTVMFIGHEDNKK